jgi:hypothetical protein
MNDTADDFDRAEQEMLAPDVSDAALEAAADPQGLPTMRTFIGPLTYIPPLCC